MIKRHVTFFLILLSLAASENALAQELPSTAEIFKKMQEQWQPIRDYTVRAQIIVVSPGIRMPRMKAKIYFKKPNLYHFEAKGFAILPKEGLGVPPDRLKKWEKYARLVGKDTLNRESVYHLLVKSHRQGMPPFQIHLYVDQKTALLKKLQMRHPGGSYMIITFHYKKVTPVSWLPDKIVSNFNIKTTHSDSMAEKFQPKMMQGRSLFGSSFKKGTIYVYLNNYKVNIGLSDAIFKKSTQKTVPALRDNKPKK